MAYVNAQAKTVSGVKKLLTKMVYLDIVYIVLARLLLLTQYKK